MIAGATSIGLDATTPSTGRDSGHSVTVGVAGEAKASSRSTRSTAHPIAKHIAPAQLAQMAAKAVFRLVKRIIIAEAVLWLTIAICALAGLPAIVTAFFAALVELLVSLWVAVRTLAPLCRKLWIGGRA